MERIAVIGCGGSGKTTLARELAARLGLPVFHIDGLYWREVDGVRVESTSEEWRQTHRELIARDRWVVDGMKVGVLRERLAAADAGGLSRCADVTCLSGVLRRRLRFRGQLRPELGVYDVIGWEFIRWIWSFQRVHRPRILELLGSCSCRVFVLRGRRELQRFIDSVTPRSTVPARHEQAEAGRSL